MSRETPRRTDPEEEWLTYSQSLDMLTTMDAMWYDRLQAAFKAGLERGYNVGYEDGREIQWGLVEAVDEKRGR